MITTKKGYEIEIIKSELHFTDDNWGYNMLSYMKDGCIHTGYVYDIMEIKISYCGRTATTTIEHDITEHYWNYLDEDYECVLDEMREYMSEEDVQEDFQKTYMIISDETRYLDIDNTAHIANFEDYLDCMYGEYDFLDDFFYDDCDFYEDFSDLISIYKGVSNKSSIHKTIFDRLVGCWSIICEHNKIRKMVREGDYSELDEDDVEWIEEDKDDFLRSIDEDDVICMLDGIDYDIKEKTNGIMKNIFNTMSEWLYWNCNAD